MYGEDDLLPLSGLQHLAFCERQWALVHIEQVWLENAETLRGEFFHERVDSHGYACVRGVRAERRVRVVSRKMGLYGVADIVEFVNDGDLAFIRPVEYKVGRPKVEDWDRVQLAAQALCLEEMYGAAIHEGALFYGETRRRERIAFDPNLRKRVGALARRMHELFERGKTPVAERGSRCRRCSLVDMCLPGIGERDVKAYWMDFGERIEGGVDS